MSKKDVGSSSSMISGCGQDGPGQQYALALTITDFGKVPVGQLIRLHQMQSVPHLHACPASDRMPSRPV